MLIKCSECGKDISDKASTCPNCGCPIEKTNEINYNKDKINKLTDNVISIGFSIILIIICVIIVINSNQNSNPNKDSGSDEDLEIKVEYVTNPITGETHITSINNTTRQDVLESTMNWLGFEKVEK